MQLEHKTAVVYGAAGMIGNVVARTFAREGAHVHLVGRTKATLDATAAARHMMERGSRVIILLSATSARKWRHEMGGFSPACAAIEALTRSLAGEVGRKGVRVVGIRTTLNPETIGVTDDDVPELVRGTILGRLPRLTELAGTAVYLASDAAAAVTGVAVNMSCGAVFGQSFTL